MEEEPVSEAHGGNHFVFNSTLGVLLVLGVIFLGLAQEFYKGFSSGSVLEFVPSVGDVFP